MGGSAQAPSRMAITSVSPSLCCGMSSTVRARNSSFRAGINIERSVMLHPKPRRGPITAAHEPGTDAVGVGPGLHHVFDMVDIFVRFSPGEIMPGKDAARPHLLFPNGDILGDMHKLMV